MKRSADGGRTWGGLSVLMDPHKMFGSDCANATSSTESCEFWDPTPVYDRMTGNIIMMTTLSRSKSDRLMGNMTVWTMTSTDHGVSFGAPIEITDQVRPGKNKIAPPTIRTTQTIKVEVVRW